MSVFTKVFAFVMVFALVMPAAVFAASPLQTAPGTPTLLSPTQGWTTTEVKPLITGLTQDNTDVAVYIDGVYNGQATVADSGNGTASFTYRPFLNLSVGWHAVKVKAQESRNNLASAATVSHEFYVAPVNPQPTLLKPVVNKETTWKKPFIVGLAKNNTTIHVYIDGEYNGKTEVVNDPSGTANFAYKPFLKLKPGTHQVHVVSEDARGHKSVVSETLNFVVTNPKAQSASVQTTNIKQADENSEAEETNTEEEKPVEETIEEAVEEAAEESAEEEVAVEEAPVEEVAEETQEEATEEEGVEEATETESSEEATEEEDTKEADDEEEDDKEDEDSEKESNSTSTIGWGLLILIAAGLVYRNRKSVKSFFSESDDQNNDDSASGGSSSGSVEVITKSFKENGKDKPKSPPPASNY